MAKLKKNLTYQFIYQILAVIIPLITTPIVTRAIGVNAYGQYSLTFAIVSYFSIFALLGVSSYGTREISRCYTYKDKDKLSSLFSEIYSLQLIMSLAIIIIYYLFVIIVSPAYKKLMMLQGMYLLVVMTDITWFFFGIEQFKITVTRNIFIKIVCLIIIILYIKAPSDIYIYSITIILSNLVSNLFLFILIFKYINYKKSKIHDIFVHLPPNLILFIPVVAASVFTYMDVIMVGKISGTIETGYYEAMEKIMSVPSACNAALATVMFPRLTALVKEGNHKKVKKYISISIIVVAWFSIACIFGMASVGDIFVPLYFGKEYYAAKNIVIMGMIIILPRGIRNIIKSECLLPIGKDREVIISIVMGSICNLFSNLLFISLYGALGAVIATIISEIITCLLMGIYSPKDVKYIYLFLLIVPLFLFGFIMYVTLIKLKGIHWNNYIFGMLFLIVCGGVIYSLLSLLYFLILKKLGINVICIKHKEVQD